MSSLFSKGTIQQEVNNVAWLDISDRIAVVKKLHAEWKNGNADDETRYEQNFNQLFFNELLGYNWQTHMHPKASTPVWGKIADIGLGHFADGKYNFDDVQVIVELKWAKIFLDKKQQRQNSQSPVDQWFGYKTSFKNCKWLIVSNFHQIRLYRDNKQDYVERTLDELVSGDDNYFALRKLLMILSAERLLSTDGSESRTEKLMTQFRIEQQKITKKFYQEYKWLRLELINDIREHNTDLDIEMVVEKAQKIIDRIVFVHFCEDKGLLPADKLKEVISYGAKALAPVWQTLTNFFEAVNSGSTKLEIPKWYNGGLFKTDPELNALRVGDEICKKFVDLGDYDFDDELSVNILGHIFEQSISDLEQLKWDLLEDGQVDSKQSKRKKDGIFYTPEYIVDYIVQNSLMKYLNEQEDACLAKVGKRWWYKTETQAYQAYQQILQNVKVLDPACGSGAFLVRVFDVLLEENKRVGIIIGGLFDESETYKNILTNNIYGVDLNPESVEITKLSLWLKSAQKGKKLNNLDENIKCGNSLIDDPAVAGERAFDWKKEFTTIMDDGGFDVIVGNPPYVSTKSTQFIWDEKKYYNAIFEVAEYQTDTYPLFVEKWVKLIKDQWILWYIMPNSWLNNLKFSKLRKFLLDTGISEITLLPSNVFADATVDTVNIFVSKSNTQKQISITEYMDLNFVNKHLIKKTRLLKNENYIFDLQITNDIIPILDKFDENGIILDQILDFSSWIKEYEIWKWKPPQTLNDKESQKFNSREKIDNTYKKHLKWNDIENYSVNRQGNYLSYWPRIAAPRKEKYFYWPRLIFREIPAKDRMVVAYTDDEFTIKNTAHIWLCKDDNFDLKYTLCLCNSRLYWFYFQYSCWEFDAVFPKAKLGQVRMLKIKKLSLKDQKPFIDKADQMLLLNKDFHDKKSSALKLLQAEYAIEKISRKLEHFYELDFADFLTAMKLKNISLDQKEDLMWWFGKKKEELASLKATIDQTDREIDAMVYELYWLSDEEIAVVEGK